MMTKTTNSAESLTGFARTKIIATVGPATDSESAVKDMINRGVDGFRLNFSHGNNDERSKQIRWIRKQSKIAHRPVAIIQDLQGPKIRLGDFEGMFTISKGQEIELDYGGGFDEDGILPIQYDLSTKVKRGQRLLMYDGKIKTTVTSVRNGKVFVKAENSGFVTKRKGINLPDTDFQGDILTRKDKQDIVYGAHHDIDYVAMSFVQTAEDIKNLKKILKGHGSTARVIAKIETKAASENLEDIVIASDAVMAARGDLAQETSAEAVPIITRLIIGKCLEYGKVSIVATQMLASMTESTEPTRAEVSDVATAVIVGADSVMLSEETASGKNPLESISVMQDIITYTQDNSPLKPVFYKDSDHTTQSAISSAIITLAHQVEAKAIIAETKSGATALSIATHRPKMPIVMITSLPRTAQQLAIVYGGTIYVRPDSATASARVTEYLRKEHILKKGDVIVTASGKYPGKVGATDTIKVRKMD